MGTEELALIWQLLVPRERGIVNMLAKEGRTISKVCDRGTNKLQVLANGDLAGPIDFNLLVMEYDCC